MWNARKTIGVLTAVVLSSTPLAAQTLSLDQVLAKHYQAIGGYR